MRANLLSVPAIAMLFALPAHAEKKCELQRYAELPVTMTGTRPLIAGTINGSQALFLADSGASFNTMSREAAEKYGLKVGVSPITVRGTGGSAQTGLATVKEFSLSGLLDGRTLKNVDFLVVGNAIAGEQAGIIGQNLIGYADTEYDLGHGVIRLFKSKDCNGRSLAYWNDTASVAEMAIESTTRLTPHLIGSAKINGKRIRIVFDSGAWRSILDVAAAARVGIKPENDDVAAAGIMRGIGRQTTETWIARFDTLDMGGEVIRNARLRIGDLNIVADADMLLGADFFLSHRIYVAASQHRIYFTYNGGAVFDLRANRTDNNISVSAPAPAPAPAPTEPGTTAAAAAAPDTPADAAGFRRRGAALAGRQDFQGAIADFDQAIRLDATDPENYYQRALARMQSRQPVLAMNDFDAVLKIKPDHIPALMSRGTLRLGRPDVAGARADFDAVAKLAPNDASLLLRIATAFENTGNFAEAIDRLTAWITANPKDERLPMALDDRCRARAITNRELDLALADCNAALKTGPRNSLHYDSRALVYLRRGDLDRCIADYKASLKLQPKNALTLYGLGIAEIRKGLRAEGDRDLQAATAINPMVAERYRRMGLIP